MNFSSFGSNFSGHHPSHLVHSKHAHDNGLHYSQGSTEPAEMSKYPCGVAPMGCQPVEAKYAPHPQYVENQQRAYLQGHEHHSQQHAESAPKGSAQRTESRGTMTVTPSWQGLVTPGVADYLARLPASALPLSLHHFLKFSSDGRDGSPSLVAPALLSPGSPNGKKKSHKKSPSKSYRPKSPQPKAEEIRLTTALDGSTLYCCPECHMAYPEKDSLERHIVSHRMERRFVCDICGAGLKRKDHLTRHKLSHNAERPYICSICMKAFKRKEHLNLHFIMHSGDKTHVCSECGKGFYCKDHLDRHKQGHNPDRPFVCTICLKGFKRNEHLARHCIIHSGDKSQVCPECGKGFYRKDHLRKHLRSHVAKRSKSEQGSPPHHPHPQPSAVTSLAAMVSMGAPTGLVGVMHDGGPMPLLSSPV